ncbi:hypothetical protein TKK_0014502 [Trichogramma kaykai]
MEKSLKIHRFNNSDLCLFTNLEDDSEWYVQMQESSMRSELLLQTVNRNTGELQQILKGLLQAVHSTHELNKTMVEQQSKMNSTLNTLATSIQSLSIAFREEKARQRQYREKRHQRTSRNPETQKTTNAEKVLESVQNTESNTEENEEYIDENEECTDKHNINEEKNEENIEENNEKEFTTPEMTPIVKTSAVKRK